MFRSVLQSSPLSLLSTTSSDPLALFETKSDARLPEDAGIVLVHDATDELVGGARGVKSGYGHLLPSSERGSPKADKASASRRSSASRHDWTMRGGSKLGSPDRDAHSSTGSIGNVEAQDSGKDSSSAICKHSTRGTVDHVVVHIQSPSIVSTFIQSPPKGLHGRVGDGLGIRLNVLHMQLRRLGASRPFMFEVGVQDAKGRPGRLRWSTFQHEPALYLPSERRAPRSSMSAGHQECKLQSDEKRTQRGALLHMPLVPPPSMQHDPFVLTPWSTLAVSLEAASKCLSSPPPSLLQSSVARQHGRSEDSDAHEDGSNADEDEGRRVRAMLASLPPFDGFATVQYVRIHANCRLRRVWFAQQQQQQQQEPYPHEFVLVAAAPAP